MMGCHRLPNAAWKLLGSSNSMDKEHLAGTSVLLSLQRFSGLEAGL